MTTPPQTRPEVPAVLVSRGRVPFAMMPKALLRGSGVSAQAVRLWAVLDSYTYGSDESAPAPTRAQLAVDCDVKSPRSIDMWLQELERSGWLTIERQRRDDGGKATNRYVLEWQPRAATQSVDPDQRPPVIDVFERVIAGQTHAQNSAHAGTAADLAIVDNPVIAGQTHAQDSAHGGIDPGTHAQNSAHPYRNENLTTKKTTTTKTPAGLGDSGGVTWGVDGGGGSDADAVRELIRVVREVLPDGTARQVTSSVLQQRCRLLVGAGWDPAAVRSAVVARSWSGAGPGAVIGHLDAMHADGPPDVDFPTRGRRPSWCGECDDERTRHVRLEDGRMCRCPRCHPLMILAAGQ